MNSPSASEASTLPYDSAKSMSGDECQLEVNSDDDIFSLPTQPYVPSNCSESSSFKSICSGIQKLQDRQQEKQPMERMGFGSARPGMSAKGSAFQEAKYQNVGEQDIFDMETQEWDGPAECAALPLDLMSEGECKKNQTPVSQSSGSSQSIYSMAAKRLYAPPTVLKVTINQDSGPSCLDRTPNRKRSSSHLNDDDQVMLARRRADRSPNDHALITVQKHVDQPAVKTSHAAPTKDLFVHSPTMDFEDADDSSFERTPTKESTLSKSDPYASPTIMSINEDSIEDSFFEGDEQDNLTAEPVVLQNEAQVSVRLDASPSSDHQEKVSLVESEEETQQFDCIYEPNSRKRKLDSCPSFDPSTAPTQKLCLDSSLPSSSSRDPEEETYDPSTAPTQKLCMDSYVPPSSSRDPEEESYDPSTAPTQKLCMDSYVPPSSSRDPEEESYDPSTAPTQKLCMDSYVPPRSSRDHEEDSYDPSTAPTQKLCVRSHVAPRSSRDPGEESCDPSTAPTQKLCMDSYAPPSSSKNREEELFDASTAPTQKLCLDSSLLPCSPEDRKEESSARASCSQEDETQKFDFQGGIERMVRNEESDADTPPNSPKFYLHCDATRVVDDSEFLETSATNRWVDAAPPSPVLDLDVSLNGRDELNSSMPELSDQHEDDQVVTSSQKHALSTTEPQQVSVHKEDATFSANQAGPASPAGCEESSADVGGEDFEVMRVSPVLSTSFRSRGSMDRSATWQLVEDDTKKEQQSPVVKLAQKDLPVQLVSKLPSEASGLKVVHSAEEFNMELSINNNQVTSSDLMTSTPISNRMKLNQEAVHHANVGSSKWSTKRIIRKSEKFASAGSFKRPTSSNTVTRPGNAAEDHSDAMLDTDSDFELTFVSHSGRPASPENFSGFSFSDAEESSRNLELLNRAIENDNREMGGDLFLQFGTDCEEERTVDKNEDQALADDESVNKVRRSTRKRLPNKRTDSVIYELDEPSSKRITRASAVTEAKRGRASSTITLSSGGTVVESKRGRGNSTITLSSGGVSSGSSSRSKKASLKSPPQFSSTLKIKTEPIDKESVKSKSADQKPPTTETEMTKPKRGRKKAIHHLDVSTIKIEPPDNKRLSAIPAISSSEAVITRSTRSSHLGRSKSMKVNSNLESTVEMMSPKSKTGKRRDQRKESDSIVQVPSARSSRSSSTSSVSSSLNSTTGEKSTRRRKRALAGQVRVLFTGFDDDEDRQMVYSLGGQIVDTSKHCSVLVTDRIRRTVKFLCAVGLGLPIVGPDWLQKSKKNGKFIDPWLHLLEDKEGEKKFDFRLSHSLLQSCEKPLLAGWVFHATPNVSPTPIEIQEIVESCGGFYVEEIEDKSIGNKVVISCPKDSAFWSIWKKTGALLVNTEAILSGVLRHNFIPENYKLV